MKYWMFFRQFAIAGVATGLLAGCNKEPLEAGPDAGERVEIVSGIALPSPSVTAGTKAPVSHIDDLQGKTLYFMRGDGYSLIQGVLYMNGSFGTQIIEATVGDSYAEVQDSRWLRFSSTQHYDIDVNKNTIMRGWYPEAVFPRKSLSLEWTFDGTQDIMISNWLAGNCSDKGINPPNHNFEFRHMLAQLQFYAYAEDGTAANQWGKLKSIVIQEQKSKCLFEDKNNNTYVITSQSTEDIPSNCTFSVPRDFTLTPSYGEITVPTATDNESNDYGAKMAGAVMIEPEQSGTIQLLITTQAAGQPEVETSVEIPAGQADIEAGEAKKIYLKFLAGEVDVTLGAAAWTEIRGTDMDVDLGTGLSASGN